ncbi:MAG TPA: DNA alkylation repair protein [Candidatus Paceibacterota bacterium]|jgi:3-methyladenine DNA glycosylase AlkD|nr:DNA alkylation repair protein [Candidatus Paceibacterota bacterium]
MKNKLTAALVEKDLRKLGKPAKAKVLSGFFKTGKGEYGEGDIFLGVTVPVQRKLAKKYKELELAEISLLLKSPIHECRLTALEILVMQYEKAKKRAPADNQQKIVDFYLKHIKHINNWDLVDATAPYILGDWLLNNERDILYTYVKSKKLWERRISIISTLAFIRAGDFKDTIGLSELLLKDTHDLMHKAVGWMLREVGKRDELVLVRFLNTHAHIMPRTALRYSIEKFPESRRKRYLNM